MTYLVTNVATLKTLQLWVIFILAQRFFCSSDGPPPPTEMKYALLQDNKRTLKSKYTTSLCMCARMCVCVCVHVSVCLYLCFK